MHPSVELSSRSISFRPDLNVMVVRWHTHASMEVIQADYAHMLAAAEQYGFCDWLLDVRRRDIVSTDVSTWVTSSFYPEAVARMAPRRLRMAVLNSPALTEAYRADPDQKKVVAYVLDQARPYDIRLFEDEGAAMQWLSLAAVR